MRWILEKVRSAIIAVCRRDALTLILACMSTMAIAGPAWAWNGVGHEVVARVAWQQLSESTRSEALRLLRATRPDAELASMEPLVGGRRGQVLFERASTWPDYVRGAVPTENRPGWHYTNFFWRQDANGLAIDLPEMKPADENVLSELPRLISIVADRSIADHDRGVALAWVLHLVGDLHQPLHCSARVTADDIDGDRGGNSFKLEPAVEGVEDFRRDNLHSLWDGALTRRYPRNFFESGWRYRERLLAEVVASPSDEVAHFDAERAGETLTTWVREGFELAKRACYPSDLVRNQPAPTRVLEMAAQEAKARMQIAGLRLASVLEAAL